MSDETPAVARQREIGGTNLQRLHVLRALGERSYGDATPSAARRRLKMLARLADGLDLDALDLGAGLDVRTARIRFIWRLDVSEATELLDALGKALGTRTLDQQRHILPVLDQLEAFVEGRDAPVSTSVDTSPRNGAPS